MRRAELKETEEGQPGKQEETEKTRARCNPKEDEGRAGVVRGQAK